ncbi:MAG: DUF503 domain-containing protein [Candidatus Omnitrophica bacterium]|nr:DUF503 domain-containing protein [Candidatus Omnitrophota bacterium]
MVIGLIQLSLRIPESQSLKGKRQILLGLKTRIRNRLNVSVSEIDHQDKWQLAALAVACVGNDRAGLNRVLSYTVEMVERERGVELIDYDLEFL